MNKPEILSKYYTEFSFRLNKVKAIDFQPTQRQNRFSEDLELFINIPKSNEYDDNSLEIGLR